MPSKSKSYATLSFSGRNCPRPKIPKQKYSKSFTDDASVVEKLGIRINLVDGDESNIKITSPLDLIIAEALISK